jgi:hypothetical protein
MRGIPALAVPTLWHYAEPFVKRALDHTNGELHADDIRALCENRDCQLWLITQGDRAVGAVTTELVNYPHRRHCRVITLGGSRLAEWMELCDNTLCAWATSQQCQGIEAFVRKGLVPKLAEIEWRHKHSIVYKELTHE